MIKPHIDHQQITYIGPVNMEQKMDLLSRARGLLNPIQWEEPFGMVMIEAMALGCPVISFERGAAPEIVTHGRSGFLVENVNEMVDCIARIDELDRVVVHAHAEQHFTARAMAEKYTRVYKKTIEDAMGKVVSGRYSSKGAPTLISPPTKVMLPLSLAHVKIDVPALKLNQASRVAQNTVETGSGVQGVINKLSLSAIDRLREKEAKHRTIHARIKGGEK
jgi:hypothetical protein